MNSFLIRAKTGLFIVALFVCAAFLPIIFLKGILCSCFLWILLYEWPKLCRKNYLLWALTPIYPIISFFLIFRILEDLCGKMLVLLLIFLVIAFDTGSYIAGFFWGKNQLCPKISPGKTIEGVFGGFFTLFLFSICFMYGFSIKYKILFLFHALMIGFSALFGDLFESLLKRIASLKDSGSILPGHGGLLDRFDALLGAVLYFYLIKDSFLSTLI